MKKKIFKTLFALMLASALMLVSPIANPLPVSADENPQGVGDWTVDIGDAVSESQAGIVMSCWGPIEPTTHPGGWGGMTLPDTCRTTWGFDEGDDPIPPGPSCPRCATIDYSYNEPVIPTAIELRALDGGSDDSFTVTVDGILVFTYEAEMGSENWYVHGPIDLTGKGIPCGISHTIEICATADAGPYWNPYGQLGIDWIRLTASACGCPCGDSLTLIDSIDIGNPASEAGHHMKDWGAPEPATSGGSWGGVANPPEDGTCRVTWQPPSTSNMKRSAYFIMTIPPCEIANGLLLRVLDGAADDSFEVYINGKLSYTYTGSQSGTEDWINHWIDLMGLKGRIWVKIKATGPAWSGFSTYGQLGVQWAKLYGCAVLDYVDIGNPMSEKYRLKGWGPIEPATNGGNWGGIDPGNCRVVWEPGKGELYRDATITMYTGWKCPPAKTLKLRVLDGLGDDSYMVLVNDQLVHWFVAPHAGKSQSEEWFTDTIDLTTKFPKGLKGRVEVIIVATADAWSSHGTYGQVAFDWAALCPAPCTDPPCDDHPFPNPPCPGCPPKK